MAWIPKCLRMLTLLLLALTNGFGGPGTLAAQEEVLSQEALEGQEAGRRAAESRGTKTFFLSSAGGGLLAGFYIPRRDEINGGAVLGVSGLVISGVWAFSSQPAPPISLLPDLDSRGAEYRDAFLTEYSDRLRRRRTTAFWAGGLTGAALGVLLFYAVQSGT